VPHIKALRRRKSIDLPLHKGKFKRLESSFNKKSHGLLWHVNMAVNCRVKRDCNLNTKVVPADRPTPNGSKIW
jgi:hypothetical protein